MSSDAGITALLLTVVTFAIIDSVDPCVFALFISILTSSLLVDVKHALKVGCSFILSLYLGYVLFGLLIKHASLTLPKSVLGLAVTIYAVITLASALYGSRARTPLEPVCRENDIPCKMASKLRLTVTGLNALTAGLLGLIASFTLLPCSAGLYFIYNIATAKFGYALWVPLTLMYVAVFVSPLVLIMVMFIGLSKIGSIYLRVVTYERVLKIVASVIMFIVALDLLMNLHVFHGMIG